MQKTIETFDDREASRWRRVYFEPLIAEIHKTVAEIKLARKGLTPAQLAEIKGLDEAILQKERYLATLQADIPQLEAEAAEARAIYEALFAQHEALAAQIDKVRQLINAA